MSELKPNQYRHGCGKVITQHGERTSHCGGCHETFEGLSLFDAHQRVNDDGSIRHLRPWEMTYRSARLRYEDGSWRGPAMPQAIADRYRLNVYEDGS